MEPSASELTSPINIQTQARTLCLSLLLILLPFAIAITLTPGLVAMAFFSACIIAYKTQCLKPFLMVLSVAFLILFLFPTPVGINYETDYFHFPAIRVIAGDGAVNPLGDGDLSWSHFKASLPDAFHRYGAALYNLTGWVDSVNSLLFIFLVPAWLTWRQFLGRWATLILICSPLVFTTCLTPTPEGATYLLLLTALGALQAKQPYLVLASILVASSLSLFAWGPSLLIVGYLLYQYPHLWKRITLVVLIGCLYNLGFFIHLFTDASLPTSTFTTVIDGDIQTVHWLGRLIHTYFVPYFIPETYANTLCYCKFMGDGMHNFGVLFRLFIWLSLILTMIYRQHLKTWLPILLICWGSLLCIPMSYMGDMNATPFIYPVAILPFILLKPRLSALIAVPICFVPIICVGWRLILITEFLTVFDTDHTEMIASDMYNVRCVAREMDLTLTSNDESFTPSGLKMYTYKPHKDIDAFPAFPHNNERHPPSTTPHFTTIIDYGVTAWTPWCLSHLHELVFASIKYRVRSALSFPRGIHDAATINHR
jgi:hypothetical protein